MTEQNRLSVGIIGGGIAGLTAAYELLQAEADVRVFEASGRVGGAIRSRRMAGYLIEEGPNALQAATPVLARLIGELGLEDAQIEAAPAAKKRYVVRGGRPVALPASPPGLLRSDLFSWKAKLRLLAEPLVRARSSETEESIADLVRRRLGPEALDYALNPFVAGIYAGDPARLSARHAFPKLYDLERTSGSLVLGGLKRARAARAASRKNGVAAPRRRTFSFAEGLQTLPDALAGRLAGHVTLQAPVVAIHPEEKGWRLTALEGSAPVHYHFSHLIYAAPLHRLAALDFDAQLDLAPLAAVSYPPVTTVALGFRREQVAYPLDGFGLLVPEVEKAFQILGTLFLSTLFPGRAPDGHVLLTTFVGGARYPTLATASEAAILKVVQRDLGALLDVRGEPAFVHLARWEQAIPQYNMGYGDVVDLLSQLEAQHPGLHFAGNYRHGISVGDAMTSGAAAAEQVEGQEGWKE
ncbi:MAG: protoporphyrinogen oxidase [Rhodothermales bacterium]